MASIRTALALALLLAPLSAREAWAVPDYIQATPDALAATYGEELAKRAFSDELTTARAARIRESLTFVPDAACPKDVGFVLREASPFALDPDAVLWIERYEVACPTPRRRSILMFKKGDAIEAVPMAPGETLADPVVQGDAGPRLQQVALGRGPAGCEQATIIETAVTHRPAEAGLPWQERWSVHACGQMVDLDVTFTPSADAGPAIAVADPAPPPGPAAASASRGPDWDGCAPSLDTNARMAACERVIASGTLGRVDLATAHRWLGDAYRADDYNNRGNDDGGFDLDALIDKLDKPDRVLAAYNKAIELNPDDPETYVRRASHHGPGEIEKTMADYSKAIALKTTDTTPYNLRAKYYRERGDLDLAIADMSGAIALRPSGTHYRGRGILHHANGAYQDAIADYDAALALEASKLDKAQYLHLRGLAYLALGNTDQAFADYTASADLVRANVLLQYSRAVTHSQAGNHETAIAELNSVIETASKTSGTLRDLLADKSIAYRDLLAPSYAWRGYAQAASGRTAEGLSDVEKSLALDPKNTTALATRGLINELLGHNDRAVADFQQVLSIEPKNTASQDALKRLGAAR
ncbi:MAG TPA: tetratricopeptide repeat protein [Hyphomicrobium sp.]|nr:tetratricopeptide repeat protein [Hyphomicrobium sp.]HRO49382.1 tetratricopeptide repeat protein [Hyphomicrobium sp.]